MLKPDVLTVFIDRVPDEIRALRDRIAESETDDAGLIWEHHRQLQGRVKELKDKCEETSHPLMIVLAGKVGTRRRLMKNRMDERRVCIMCGVEEVGTIASGLFSRCLRRRAKWKFARLNGYISRTFSDPQWYLETVSIIRNFSFSTDIILQHAFPLQLPSSLMNASFRKGAT